MHGSSFEADSGPSGGESTGTIGHRGPRTGAWSSAPTASGSGYDAPPPQHTLTLLDSHFGRRSDESGLQSAALVVRRERGEDIVFTAAELLTATGQSMTPAMLADQEKLMHERRLMAYHNTRLVLALQALGAVGDAALETLQVRSSRPPTCGECEAAQQQLAAMDKTLARASLSTSSAKEQVAAVKRNLNAAVEESRGLRSALMRCDEVMRSKDAELALLRTQVQQSQPALEEVLALRRTQSELMQRIRMLQETESTVRIVGSRHDEPSLVDRSDSRDVRSPVRSARPIAGSAEAETQTLGALAPSAEQCPLAAPITVADWVASERLRQQLQQLEFREAAQRIDQISRFFDFHHLVGVLWRTEATAAELRNVNAALYEERQQLQDSIDDYSMRCRDLEIELRTERTRTAMRPQPTLLASGTSAGMLPPRPPSPPVPSLHPPAPAAAGPQRPRHDAAVEEMKRDVWRWAMERVQATLDDAMQQIQLQVDEAYLAGRADGIAAARDAASSRMSPAVSDVGAVGQTATAAPPRSGSGYRHSAPRSVAGGSSRGEATPNSRSPLQRTRLHAPSEAVAAQQQHHISIDSVTSIDEA